ncbi:MAG: hypothetical protein EA350_12740 [Gemmatimonadales bacterium]|nr:MAG: hypothetical protein EA350_12740 [Gemmatimonadales bacterium]
MIGDGLDLRVDSRLLRTETGEELSTPTARGAREANRIEDAETAPAVSQTVDRYDRGEYLDARERLARVSRRARGGA